MNDKTETKETSANNVSENNWSESGPEFLYEIQGWFAYRGEIAIYHAPTLKVAIKVAEKLISRKVKLSPEKAEENEAEGFDDCGVMIVEHLKKTLFAALIRKRSDMGWCYRVEDGCAWAPVDNYVHG